MNLANRKTKERFRIRPSRTEGHLQPHSRARWLPLRGQDWAAPALPRPGRVVARRPQPCSATWGGQPGSHRRSPGPASPLGTQAGAARCRRFPRSLVNSAFSLSFHEEHATTCSWKSGHSSYTEPSRTPLHLRSAPPCIGGAAVFVRRGPQLHSNTRVRYIHTYDETVLSGPPLT